MTLAFGAASALSFAAETESWQAGPPPGIGGYLRKLHPHGIRQRFARNATVFFDGDASDRVWRIERGVVRLCKHTADGRRHVVDFALAGEIFGYVRSASQTFTAEAVNDVVAISYPKRKFLKLAEEEPGFATLLLTRLHGDIAAMQRQLLLLGCHDARERLTSFLLRLAERSVTSAGERLALAMGRQDIADHLGLTVETICRTLKDLKAAGAIAVPNARELVLRDLDVLRAIAPAA
jgi:CRP/FNR family nitrogen fixation transcriptional regulator